MRNHFEAIIEKGCIFRKKSSNLFITIVKLEGPFDNNRFKITQQYSKKTHLGGAGRAGRLGTDGTA